MAQKLVSFNKLDSILDAQRSEPVVLSFETKGEPVSITVKTHLSLPDMQRFIRAVVDNSFDVDGSYHSEMFDTAIALQVLNYYTDIKIGTDGDNNVTSVMEGRLCRMMYDSNVYETILHTIHGGQFQQMIDAIRDGIKYRTQVELSTMKKDVDDMVEKFENITNYLEQMSEAMGDVSTEELRSVLKKITDNDNIAVEKAAIHALREEDGLGDES